ncbi:hypothetical protein GCM10029964_087700 [Kibdelosporangium lantanae]
MASGALGRLVGLPDVPAIRRWAWVAVADSLGTGLVTPLVIIYFTQQLGMNPVSVGLAMTIAGIGCTVLVPFGGMLVDRFGAKPVVITAFVAACVGTAGYMLARDFGTLTVTVLLAQMADATGRPAKHSLIAQIAEGEARNRLLAFNRSVRNAGYGLGACWPPSYSGSTRTPSTWWRSGSTRRRSSSPSCSCSASTRRSRCGRRRPRPGRSAARATGRC